MAKECRREGEEMKICICKCGHIKTRHRNSSNECYYNLYNRGCKCKEFKLKIKRRWFIWQKGTT